MSKSLVDTCIYETCWSIKLLPYANITDISTDIISVSLLNFTDITNIADIGTDTDTDINIGASLLATCILKIAICDQTYHARDT